MKKKILIGVLVLTLVVGAFAVYADSSDINEFDRGYGHMNGNNSYGNMIGEQFNQRNERINPSANEQWPENRRGFCEDQRDFSEEEREQWLQETQDERSEYREEAIKRDLENGIIDQEQADKWRAHFAERDKFNEENGYRYECCDGERRGRTNNSNNNSNRNNNTNNNNRNGHKRGHGNGMMGGYNY